MVSVVRMEELVVAVLSLRVNFYEQRLLLLLLLLCRSTDNGPIAEQVRYKDASKPRCAHSGASDLMPGFLGRRSRC